MEYVLVTAAAKEEDVIGLTLSSICTQTVLPERWVIVLNNSNEQTREVVALYEKRFNFIHCLTIEDSEGCRNFGAQVRAIRTGYEHLSDILTLLNNHTPLGYSIICYLSEGV